MKRAWSWSAAGLVWVLGLCPSPPALADTTLSEGRVVRNSSNTGDYTRLFQELRGNHIEYILTSKEHNIRLEVSYFQQHEIEGREFTEEVLVAATDIFFDWAKEKGFSLNGGSRRDHRGLSVYDLKYKTLNNIEVIDFTSIARKAQKKQQKSSRVNALYEAHHTHNGDNALLLSADRAGPERYRARTMAHELAHWWLDYFRIYDKHYIQSNGKADMETPAYEFQRYFDQRRGY